MRDQFWDDYRRTTRDAADLLRDPLVALARSVLRRVDEKPIERAIADMTPFYCTDDGPDGTKALQRMETLSSLHRCLMNLSRMKDLAVDIRADMIRLGLEEEETK